jgi:hypothetical protein
MKTFFFLAIIFSFVLWTFNLIAEATTPKSVAITHLPQTGGPKGNGSEFAPYSLESLPQGDYSIETQCGNTIKVHPNFISVFKTQKPKFEWIYITSPIFQKKTSGRLVKDWSGEIKLFEPLK